MGQNPFHWDLKGGVENSPSEISPMTLGKRDGSDAFKASSVRLSFPLRGKGRASLPKGKGDWFKTFRPKPNKVVRPRKGKTLVDASAPMTYKEGRVQHSWAPPYPRQTRAIGGLTVSQRVIKALP